MSQEQPECLHTGQIGHLVNEEESPCQASDCDDAADYNCLGCDTEYCETHAEEPFRFTDTAPGLDLL